MASREGDRTLARFELVRVRHGGHEQHAPARFVVSEPGLDPASGVALYAQLAELWRYNIVSRRWPSGHRLANFETLAAEYKVARVTVRQAVARLVQEGLLSTQRGRGTFVLGRREGEAPQPPRVGAGTWPEHLEIEVLYNQPGQGAAERVSRRVRGVRRLPRDHQGAPPARRAFRHGAHLRRGCDLPALSQACGRTAEGAAVDLQARRDAPWSRCISG